MVRQMLENRVEKLENRMSALEELPARVANLESQILQFRDEVRVDFSAVRGEMRDQGEQLRSEMRGMGEQIRGELSDKIVASEGRLRAEIDRVLSQARMLHEDVIDRIKLTGEK